MSLIQIAIVPSDTAIFLFKNDYILLSKMIIIRPPLH